MTKEEVLCILEAPGWALQDVERAYERYERAYSRCTGGAIRYDKEGTSGGGGAPVAISNSGLTDMTKE